MKNKPGRERSRRLRRQPAGHSQAARRIGARHAGAGSLGAADSPMESGGLASRSALRKEPEERPAVVQRLSLWHLGRRDLHGARGARSDGLAQGGGGWIRPMDVAADGSQIVGRSSPLGASRSSKRTLLGGARMSDARRGAKRRRRPHGRHPRLRSRLHRLGFDRALLDDRRHRLAQGGRTADRGQCRVDAPPAAGDVESGARRRTPLVQGLATGPSGHARQRRPVDAVL